MNLCQQLKSIVDDYFKRHKNTSINGLANKAQVAATTLRRIVNLSIKGDPAPHTVLNIVSTIYKEKRLAKLLSMLDGPIYELLNHAFGSYVQDYGPYKYDIDLNEILADKINYFIYKLAANRVGVTKIKIIELFGRLGQEKIDYMINLGQLMDQDGILHAKDKNFCLDLSIAKKHLSELVKFYKPDEIPLDQNIFYSQSESLNIDGIKKIKKIQREAVKQIHQVMNCKYYEGDIPYFTVNLGDTLDFNQSYGSLQ